MEYDSGCIHVRSKAFTELSTDNFTFLFLDVPSLEPAFRLLPALGKSLAVSVSASSSLLAI